MAVGETSGAGRHPAAASASFLGRRPPPPRRGRRRPRTLAENEPLIKEADPELERLLAEEEEIERRVHDHHETPHFRPGDE